MQRMLMFEKNLTEFFRLHAGKCLIHLIHLFLDPKSLLYMVGNNCVTLFRFPKYISLFISETKL